MQPVSHSQNQLVVTRSTSSQAFARNINLQCSPRFFFLSLQVILQKYILLRNQFNRENKLFIPPPPLLLPCPFSSIDYVVGNIIQGGSNVSLYSLICLYWQCGRSSTNTPMTRLALIRSVWDWITLMFWETRRDQHLGESSSSRY